MSIKEKLEVITDKIYEKGKKDEHSDFWDVFQNNGKRVDYVQAFGVNSGAGAYSDANFKPKYDIKPTNATNMFRMSKINKLKETLDSCGIVLDTSNCSNCNYMFQTCSKLTHVPTMNFTKCSTLSGTFTYCENLETIDKIILSTSGATSFENTFYSNNSLVNVEFEGVIGKSISFAFSPLSIESMKSIISHLKNYSGTSDAMKYTLTFNSDCWSRLNASELPDGFNAWQVYVNSLGWIDGVV